MVNCQLYPPSESSLTDIETGPSSDCGALQPLCRNPTISSIVPETPRTDSSSSFLPPPDPVRESHLKISQTDLPRRAALPTNPHVGTPSAVGAIRKSNGFLPIATPAVARGPSSLPRSFAMDISMKPLITGYADPTDSEFNETDAQFVLELARVCHNVCRLEQELAEARYSESMALVNLYKHRAECAKKQHDYAEFDLGHARDLAIRNPHSSQMLSVIRRPNPKCPRLSSPGEQHRGTLLSGSPEV
ncbi:hypothetical protein L210DRAFT_3510805 [Boletus edulis BED1]|uniref:Uncharacterized protein n=1 Tax=Boletus edulis BED1 TaxID=1328754 RepID=A0AAD4BD70_BOLED|nr:hypothetical protein L210DRAFT_3510805 [Boletus edulis BED1]